MPNQDLNSHGGNRVPLYLFATFAMLLFAICFCNLPNFIILGEFYRFDAPTASSLMKSYLPHAQITLDDDIMIAMRAGYMIHTTGIPQYNLNDIAQPSTSYIAPYLFYLIDFLFPRTIAPLVYGFLFLAAAIGSFLLIYKAARIKTNAIIFIIAFLFTTTFISQGFRGWDHFLQGFLICAALMMFAPKSRRSTIFSALLNVSSVAARPDTLIISFAILVICLLQIRSDRRLPMIYVTVYAAGLACLFGYNLLTFDHIFPTPIRLKTLAGSDLSLKFKYISQNLLVHFTAGQIWIVLFTLILINHRRYLDPSTRILFFASVLSAIIANVNGDVFYGFRMMWSPALVLAFIVVSKADQNLLYMFWTPSGNRDLKSSARMSPALLLICSISLLLVGRVFFEKNIRMAANVDYRDSEMSRQYAMADWVNANLAPKDGAIGLFYAGTAYHLPLFDIADLLGKGDELIAKTTPKWGSPRHNKWNFDLSISKWNPQALFVETDLDPSKPETISAARYAMKTQADGSYVYEIFINELIRAQYQYCYISSPHINHRSLALLLRHDIAKNLIKTRPDHLDCIAMAALN